MSMVCPSCGAAVPRGTAACAACHAAIVSDKADATSRDAWSTRLDEGLTGHPPKSRRWLLRHAAGLFRSPKAEWAKIAAEPSSASQVFWRYGAVLGIIVPICSALSEANRERSPGHVLLICFLSYFFSALTQLFVFSWVIKKLSRPFGCSTNFADAMKVGAYGTTPYYLTWFGTIFSDLAGLSVFYMTVFVLTMVVFTGVLIRYGLTAVMAVPRVRSMAFAVILLAVYLILGVVTGLPIMVLSGTGPTSAPLVPAGKAAEVSAQASPYDGFGVEARSADQTVLVPAAELQARMRADAQAAVAAYWPAGSALPDRIFVGFDRPAVGCPPNAPDGEVCAFTFTPIPRTEPTAAFKAPGILSQLDLQSSVADEARTGVVTMRLDIDNGDTPEIEPRIDIHRPLLASGDATPRTVTSTDEMDFGPLGRRTVVCRADAPPDADWERRTCSIEIGPFGPNQLTVGRDAYLPGARAFENAEDDPILMGYLHDGAKFLAHVVGGDPVLERALEPIRAGNDSDAMFDNLVTHGAADSKDGTDTPRALVAANTPLLRWHDVASQREFDAVCAQAASERRPLLIYSTRMNGLQKILYQEAFKLFSKPAMLVLIRMTPPVGDNAWATAFSNAIGAGEWPAFTVTDKPRMLGGACRIGKVYQGPASDLRIVDLLSAVLKGEPPKPNTDAIP